MINPEELAICKRRGHDAGSFLDHGWLQCKWCGLWLREVRTIETKCLGICPKKAVTAISASSPGRIVTVPKKTAVGEALDLILGTTVEHSSPNAADHDA